jgi:hypothetical protein
MEQRKPGASLKAAQNSSVFAVVAFANKHYAVI